MMNFVIVKKAFKQTIPVLMGYLVLGCAFGMLLVDSGYPIYYALIMSVFYLCWKYAVFDYIIINGTL